MTVEPRTILDTSILVGPPIDPIPGVLAVSAATLAELHFGVLVAKTPDVRAERLRRLSVIERRFEAIPVDEMVAASYGQLAEAVVRSGRQVRARTMDLLIAATAHAHSARLYTRNAEDLTGLEDLLDVVAI